MRLPVQILIPVIAVCLLAASSAALDAGDLIPADLLPAEKLEKGKEIQRETSARLTELGNKVEQLKLAPLPMQLAIPFLIASLFFIFFGCKIYKVGICLYMSSVGGWIAIALAGDALLYALVGMVLGGLIALPLEVVVRTMIGALAGAVIGVLLTYAVGDNLTTVMIVAGIGFLAGGVVTFFFRRLVLIVGFSLWGATLGTYSVLSLYQGPETEFLTVRPAVVAGLLGAAVIGVVFQYMLDSKAGTDVDGDGVPDG